MVHWWAAIQHSYCLQPAEIVKFVVAAVVELVIADEEIVVVAAVLSLELVVVVAAAAVQYWDFVYLSHHCLSISSQSADPKWIALF